VEDRGGGPPVLVDTNLLVSKRLRDLIGLGRRLVVTPVVVLEYMNWAVESRNRALARGELERAAGYERLLHLLPGLLDAIGAEIVEQQLDTRALEEAAALVTEWQVDPGDALNAVTAARKGLAVATGDQDWLRLRDYTVELILMGQRHQGRRG
jgi:predicted nucleic acid-binding protein